MRQVDPVGLAVWVALASAIGAFPKGTPHRFLKSVAVFIPAAVVGAFAADKGGFLGLFAVGALAWFVGRISTEFTASKSSAPPSSAGEPADPTPPVQAQAGAPSPPTTAGPPLPATAAASSLWGSIVGSGWGRLYLVASVAWLAWRVYAVNAEAMDEWGNWRDSDYLNVLLTGIVLPVVAGAAALWVRRGFQRVDPIAK